MAFAFDKSEEFAIDKQAGTACEHLDGAHRCKIHDELSSRGFSGCAQYDCRGAGQRVTQELFAGRSWRDDSTLIEPMMEAFRGMRRVHDTLELLMAMESLKLANEQMKERSRLLKALTPKDGWTVDRLLALERGPVFGDVQDLLAVLRAQLEKTLSS